MFDDKSELVLERILACRCVEGWMNLVDSLIWERDLLTRLSSHLTAILVNEDRSSHEEGAWQRNEGTVWIRGGFNFICLAILTGVRS